MPPPLRKPGDRSAAPAKYVYGWYPYWLSSTAYQALDYSVLSHIAYFSYETDITSGEYLTVRDWNTTPLIAYAHERGVKVTLTVTNFGYDENDALLSDTVKQNRMIASLIALLKARNGDGVSFDLEMVRNTQRANLVAFMQRATARIKAELPNAEISMATPAVDWSGAWDFPQLSQICDYLIVMGYDYYYSGSSTAGPNAPLEGENYNVTRTVNTYLNAGVPSGKLLLGVPWFGFDWPVTSSARKAPTTGAGSSRTYVVAEQMAATASKVFDDLTKTPWFAYLSGSAWRQVWYDDSLSLALKYELVNTRSLGGIGIWALGYDGARKPIWYGMRAAFAPAGVVARQPEATPVEFVLEQNWPNPFNPKTTIGIRQQAVGNRRVKLTVYDLLGREMAVLVDERKEPGRYEVQWDGSRCASGMYVYRLIAGDHVDSKTMMLLK